MILDKEFLKKLDQQKNKEIFVRIVALNWKEQPVEKIEGRATGGSINIDGASAVRRTCSLSLVAEDVNINMFYWGIESKFELFVGVKNRVDPNYEDIIWFKQGIYVITSFNISQTTNNFTISISGKDKMCLLNGEINGSLPSSVDFGVQEIHHKASDGTIETIEYYHVPIKTIIKEMVHTYAKEPYGNIIILDIPDYGSELMEYRGESPLYFIKNGNIVTNMTLITPTSGEYQKVEKYETAGYRATSLTYAGDLIANVGESITSILDKIKNMLGEYEYFYDLDGRFIFQQKKIYVNTPFNRTNEDILGRTYLDPSLEEYSYSFNDQILVSSFQNTPNLANVKNDFSIWGTYKSVSGASIPIHLRCAIDKKPETGETGYKTPYSDGLSPEDNENWRYTIYRMAHDFYKHGTDDDFTEQIQKENHHMLNGQTGYEQYYQDIYSFWEDELEGTTKGSIKFEEVKDMPVTQKFWIDFIDADSSIISQFSVPAIGQRAKVTNDNNVTAIYYSETPEAVLVETGKSEGVDTLGFTRINLPSSFAGLFSISARGKSAADLLNEQLYNFGYCAQSILISAIPIYYLEPNTKIKVYDPKSKINGDYMLSKITIPLNYNGTMSLSATKIENRII